MKLSSIFYPAVCPFCGKVISENEWKTKGMCIQCDKYLKPFSNYHSVDRNDNYPSCDEMYCSLKYFGPVKNAIIKYKFKDASYLYKPFSVILNNQLLANGVYDKIDILTYVPISSKRFATRGYNQSYLIAKELFKLNKGRFQVMNLFARKKGNEVKTSSLNIEQRKIEKYQYKSKESVFGKKMLLLDDILTTGATIEECAKILKMHGAAKVIGAVLASGRRDF